MTQESDPQVDDMEVETEMDESNDYNNNNQGRISYGYNKFVNHNNGLSHEESSEELQQQRCHLPRRFAAGHAEMQPSAFRSTHNTEDEAEDLRSSNKSKSSPLEAANCDLTANMDSSIEAYYDSQRQKRPRRFTKEDPTTSNQKGASSKGDQG